MNTYLTTEARVEQKRHAFLFPGRDIHSYGMDKVIHASDQEQCILAVLSQIYQDFLEKWKILSSLLMLRNFLTINHFKQIFSTVKSLSCPFTVGPWVLAVCLSHRHPGCNFPGDTEDLFCQILQSGCKLKWRGLDHFEGRFQTKGRRVYFSRLFCCH